MTTHTPSPTDALQKAREIAELEKKQSKDWFTDDDSDIDSPDGLIATCHDSDDHAPFIVALRNAFPSIHAELERVTAERDELKKKNLWWETHMGFTIPDEYRKWGCDAAKMMAEENEELRSDRDAALKGYREMREAISFCSGSCHSVLSRLPEIK